MLLDSLHKSFCQSLMFAASLTLAAGSLSAADFLSHLDKQAAANSQITACANDRDCEENEDEEKLNYGPCDCDPRKTLFQWSYGTSFSGGPDLDEPLVTDRPDFTEATTTVGRGVYQLEAGYTYTFDQSGTDFTNSNSYPETLLRVGILAEWLELRIGWNYSDTTTFTNGTTQRISGSEDLYLGFKIALTPQECWLPEMVIIPQMTVPSGTTLITANEVLPGVNWVYGWEINDFISTAGQTQVNRALDQVTTSPYLEFSQSWTIGYSLTEKIGAYTEWYCLVPDGADSARTEHYFNGGFTFLLTNDLQLDIRGGVGLNDAADDYFLGSGFAKRF